MIRLLGLAGLCLLAGVGAVQAQNNAKVDKLFAEWDKADSPGASVVIVKDGKVVYQHAYGLADIEHHIKNTPQTLFDIASVSKQFTGLSMAMLIQQGKVAVGDDIHKYLPDVPNFEKPITIQNLLHHTSGLRDWPEALRFAGLSWNAPITMETIFEMVRKQRELDFVPGSEYQYSNTGYNLLAATVAHVAGQPFPKFLETNVFRPVGMKHTVLCDDPTVLVPNRALSYVLDQGAFHENVSLLCAQGSSSIFTSAEDMGQWLINFQTAAVGGKTAFEMMEQPGKLNDGGDVAYGFGLRLDDYRGTKEISHGGSWAGYRSQLIWLPEQHFAVAVLANSPIVEPGGVAHKIVDLYLNLQGKPPEPTARKAKPETVSLSPDRLKAYAGDYWSEELSTDLRIEVQDGKLGYRNHNTGHWILFEPVGPDHFQAGGGDKLDFTSGPNSSITELKMSAGRVRNLRFKRVTLPGY